MEIILKGIRTKVLNFNKPLNIKGHYESINEGPLKKAHKIGI
jgi:hypothetical protein